MTDTTIDHEGAKRLAEREADMQKDFADELDAYKEAWWFLRHNSGDMTLNELYDFLDKLRADWTRAVDYGVFSPRHAYREECAKNRALQAELTAARAVVEAGGALLESTDLDLIHEEHCDLRPHGRVMSMVVPTPSCDCAVRDVAVARKKFREALTAYRAATKGVERGS